MDAPRGRQQAQEACRSGAPLSRSSYQQPECPVISGYTFWAACNRRHISVDQVEKLRKKFSMNRVWRINKLHGCLNNVVSLWSTSDFLGKRNSLGQWLSKCDPQTSSNHIPWKVVRNVNSQSSSQIYWIRNADVGPAICVLISPSEDPDGHSSLRTTGIGNFAKPNEKFSNWQPGPSPAHSSLKVTEHKACSDFSENVSSRDHSCAPASRITGELAYTERYAGLSSYDVWVKSSTLQVFVNKALLEYSHSHSFT